MKDSATSVPKLGGRNAAFVIRILAIARARGFPLAPAMTAAADIEGLGQAREFARFVDGMDDDAFLDALGEALVRSGQGTGAEVVAMLRTVGLPADSLRRLADWFTAQSAARHRMFSAISYPFTLTIVAGFVYGVLIHLLLMPWIIDAFKDLFGGLGASLPMLTAVVIGFYDAINQWMSHPVSAFIYVGAVVAVAVILVRYVMRFSQWRISLYVPLARRFLFQEASASFSRSLALLLDNGVDAPEAIRLAAAVPANRALGSRLAKIADRVESGDNLAECLRVEPALLPEVRWRLWSAYYRSDFVAELRAVDEQMIRQMRNTESRIVNSSRILMSFVAAIAFLPVGIAVIAMYLPMFSLISQIG